MIPTALAHLLNVGLLHFALGVFVLLALFAEVGFRAGRRYLAGQSPADKEMAGISALTGGMLALMAFVLALTISFAQNRFEARRDTTLTEANTIGTAWLRTDLAGPAGKPVAALIEDYARARLAYIEATERGAVETALTRTNALQAEIWARTMRLLPEMSQPLAASLVASLNDMFDANLSQRFALESLVPMETMVGLLAGAILAIGALGFQIGLTGRRHALLGALLIGMLSGGMVLVVDLNRPRLGFMRVDTGPLVWTLQGFPPPSPAPAAAKP